LCIQHALLLLLLVGSLSLSLNGCGFQLRGSKALPATMAVTYIQTDTPFSTLRDDFRTALRAHGASVTDDRAAATAVLRIVENREDKRVLTVDIGGRVQEYEIRQSIRFVVTTADNRPAVPEQAVSLSRDFVFSPTDVLGKEREEQRVREELQRDIVNLALLRITTISR